MPDETTKIPGERSRLRSVGRVLAIPVGLYLVILVALFAIQDRLLFFPDNTGLTDGQIARAIDRDGAEELRVRVPGASLHGFFLPGQAAAPRPTLLYFGGNAEATGLETGEHGPLRARGWNVVLMAHRGYGRSEGEPSGEALVSDALLVYDAVAARPDVDASRIATWGRSLGTGVATQVAAGRDVLGVVLASPYLRLSAAASHHYPWLPVRLLFRHEIDSAVVASQIDTPALFFHGTDDQVIPHEQAVALRAVWRPTPRLVSLDGYGHNDVSAAPSYPAEGIDFLDAL